MPRSRNFQPPKVSRKYMTPNDMRIIKELCTPAYIYLIISILAIVIAMFQNAGKTKSYTFCGYKMNVENTGLVFLFKGIIIVFWTIVLDSLCKNGFTQISWLLLALPFIGFLCALVTMSSREGFREGTTKMGDGIGEPELDPDPDPASNDKLVAPAYDDDDEPIELTEKERQENTGTAGFRNRRVRRHF